MKQLIFFFLFPVFFPFLFDFHFLMLLVSPQVHCRESSGREDELFFIIVSECALLYLSPNLHLVSEIRGGRIEY
jgi:hypothetical protein